MTGYWVYLCLGSCNCGTLQDLRSQQPMATLEYDGISADIFLLLDGSIHLTSVL